MVDVSVIIPFYNAPELCYQLIAHLEAYFNRSGYSSEFIVVDDGSGTLSSRKLINLLQGFDNIRYYMNNVNRGQYASMAYGISKAKGTTMIITDQDLPPLQVKYLDALLSKRTQFDLQYVYDDDNAHGSLFRRAFSTVWHEIIKRVVPKVKIDGNPMPFRVVSGALVQRLKEGNYVTSIIDIELLLYSNSAWFLKIEKDMDPDIHNVSKYSALKIVNVMLLSLSNIMGKRRIHTLFIAAILIAVCWFTTHSVFLMAGMLTISAIIGTMVYITNRRHCYDQQVARVESSTMLVEK